MLVLVPSSFRSIFISYICKFFGIFCEFSIDGSSSSWHPYISAIRFSDRCDGSYFYCAVRSALSDGSGVDFSFASDPYFWGWLKRVSPLFAGYPIQLVYFVARYFVSPNRLMISHNFYLFPPDKMRISSYRFLGYVPRRHLEDFLFFKYMYIIEPFIPVIREFASGIGSYLFIDFYDGYWYIR